MKKTVGIIGGTGQMGEWFKNYFENHNYNVLIASRSTKLSIEDCAKKSDLVIITVPIDKTVEIIKRVGPLIKKEACLMDFTSLKQDPLDAMLKYSDCEVVGAHPVFGPSVSSLKNQTIVLCKGRGELWFNKLKNLFEKSHAKVKVATAKEHDKMMAIIQGVTHFSSIAIGHAFKQLDIDINETLEYTSPIYKLRMDMVGRVLNQDPRLYADIEILNPETHKVVSAYIESAEKLRDIIEKNDINSFIKYFNKASDNLGDFRNEAMEYSNYIIEKLVNKRHTK